nr:MAG TPA: hypothetical protein [Caudoviricetes sp.]
MEHLRSVYRCSSSNSYSFLSYNLDCWFDSYPIYF